MRECITHFACDCTQALLIKNGNKVLELEKELVALRAELASLGNEYAIVCHFKAENEKLREALGVAMEALKDCEDHCLCERFKTIGFDYSEAHRRLGKPGVGKRWLTPRDIARSALARISKAGK